MPAVVAFDDAVGFGRAPGAGLVDDDGVGVLEYRLDDPPRLLHRVLAGEAAGVALEGVVEQALVGVGGPPGAEGVRAGGEVGRPADELLAEGRHVEGEADPLGRSAATPQVVGAAPT